MKAPEGKEITDSWPGIVKASDVPDLPGKAGSRAPDKAALVYTVGAGGRSGATPGADEALKETLKLPLVLFVPGPGPLDRTEAERREVWEA